MDDDSPEEKKIRLDEQINSENSDDVSEKDPQNHVISEANDASADSDGENHDAVDVTSSSMIFNAVRCVV